MWTVKLQKLKTLPSSGSRRKAEKNDVTGPNFSTGFIRRVSLPANAEGRGPRHGELNSPGPLSTLGLGGFARTAEYVLTPTPKSPNPL